MLTANEIADLLDEIGERLEMEGDSRFKSRAYYKAADSLRALGEPLPLIIEEGRVREIPGIGEAIAEKVETMYSTGTHRTLERLRQHYPASVLELLAVPRLRAEQAAALYTELGIRSLQELGEALEDGRVAGHKKFGPKFVDRVEKALELMRQSAGKILLHRAWERETAACQLVRAQNPDIEHAEPAGEPRRGFEVISDLRIAARSTQSGSRAIELDGVHAEVADSTRYGVVLLHSSSGQEHFEQLTRLAASHGLTLTPDSLSRGEEPVACADEESVYSALGLDWIPPELRDGNDEIATAAAGELPELVRLDDIRGILHSHTDFSDGVETLERMAEAVRARGFSYYGVSDHSKTAFYAGGLQVEKLLEQGRLVDSLNESYRERGIDFRIFKGIESDILIDGSLDYPDEVLATLDFVVASIHGQFATEESKQTERIIRAVSNPYTTILGHMTGRLLLRREGYKVDVGRILQACAKHGVAVEINSNPNRLDLDWRWHRRALELGCTMAINPDAHSISEIDLVKWGVLQARRGGVPATRVLNMMELTAISDHFAKRKPGG